MKKLLLSIYLILICILGYGQTYPVTQNLGAASTLVKNPNYGGFQGGFIPYTFADTSAANAALTYGKNYNGFQIYTQTPQATWWRLADSSKWIMNIPQGGGTPVSGQAWINPGNYNLFTDGNYNGGFGTLARNGIYFKTNGVTRFYLDKDGIAPQTSNSVGLGYDPTDSNRLTQYSGGSGGTVFLQETKHQMDSLIGISALIAGVTYKITGVDPTLYDDGTTSGTTIFLKAVSTTQLSLSGSGLFYNPKYDQGVAGFGIWSNYMSGSFSSIVGNFDYLNKETVTADNAATGIVLAEGLIQWVSGDWSAATSITGDNSGATADISSFTSPSYSIGDKVIWGGYSWSNVAGNVGSSTDALTLDAEWTKDVYDTTNYNIAIDDIQYDYGNDLIVYRADKAGNLVSGSKGSFDDWGPSDYGFIGNPISVFQWGNPFDAINFIGVGDNKVLDSYCENINFAGSYFWYNSLSEGSYINSNTLSSGSSIYYNTLSSGSSIYYNTLSSGSSIYYNTLSSSNINSNTLSGNSYIYYNTLSGNSSIYYNTLSSGSYINYNTLSSGSSIYYNTLSSGSSIYYNTLSGNSSIYYNTLSSGSYINYNTLSSGSYINYNTLSSSNINSNTLINNSSISIGLSYTLSGKTIQNVTLSTAIINVDITAATYIFATYPREVYTRPDGTVRLKFINNSDVLEVHAITD